MKSITDFIVLRNERLGNYYFRLTLQHPGVLPPIEVGQFVEVEVRNCREVMLRRPISIHDVDKEHNRLSLLIQIVGKGTRRLAELKEGEVLNMVYPLGHGFSLAGQRPLLVGGGAGIAPLLYLAKCYKARGVEPTVLLGGRTRELIPVDYDYICTCGPTPMMWAVGRHALQKGIDCEVSLENMMACGIGACLCCVCNTDEGHKCVCKEGPVFNVKKLTQWIAEGK